MREQEKRSFGATPLVCADRVQGKDVYNRQGDKLGSVKDIYIDKTSGKVEFATLAYGGVLGAGQKFRPLPWAALDFDLDRGGFVVDLDKAVLETAPSYDADELEQDTGWGAAVSDFYRNRPMETYGGSPGAV